MTIAYDESFIRSGRRSGQDRRVYSDPGYQGPERRVAGRRSETDKRKHARYRVKDHIYVNLRSESGEEVGQMMDISKGGLSLQYLVRDEAPRHYKELGILSGMDLAMERIPYRTVSDTEIINNFQFSTTRLRMVRLQFSRLTPLQEAKLDYFIRNFTAGTA